LVYYKYLNIFITICQSEIVGFSALLDTLLTVKAISELELLAKVN